MPDFFRALFNSWLNKISYDLTKFGLTLDIKKQPKPPVQTAMLKFKEVLYQLGLTEQKSAKLSITLEVDANPPKGFKIETSLITRHFVFAITHFDISSLYALKLHACFFRKYTKGRDFYDLLWYLGRKAVPNFKLLNNAIEQTEKKKLNINANNFREFLQEHLAKIDFNQVKRDISRFIEDKNELKLLDKATILKLV
ncbi:MAG: nucleotidyl transferase AbiEii/AbiGii toxin family protein [candidate division WOR-3 bacterium]